MSDILEAVAYKNDILREKLNKFLGEYSIKDKLDRGWFKLNETGSHRFIFDTPEIALSAVDGGNNKKSLLSLDLYVIKASAEGFKIDLNGSMKKAFSRKIVDVDVIVPTENSGDRLTLYRQVAETKMLLYSLGYSNLVLGDGSLESLVTRPIHAKLRLLDDENELSLNLECSDLEKIIIKDIDENPHQSMSVKNLVEEIVMEKSTSQEDIGKRVLYLEMLEKAIVLRLLFSRLLESNSVLAFITKTGRSRKFFNAPVSDQYVLSTITSEAGYYLDEDKSFVKPKDMIKELPRKCGLRELSEKLTYVKGLIRLENKASVLGLEVIYNSERISLSQKEVFLGILDILRLISPGGYPQPLYIVDRETHIDNRDVNKVLVALGLSFSLTGREVLEYE